MEFTEKAVTCGTDKKGDLLVTLELGGNGREIEIKSKGYLRIEKYNILVKPMWL